MKKVRKPRKQRIAIFASGRGTNFEAVVKALRRQVEIVALVCDRPDAQALQRARRLRIRVILVERVGTMSREEHEKEILRHLESVDWIVLAGWRRIFSRAFFETSNFRTINIHPSLLPSFKGLNSYAQAFDYGCTVTGVTIHLVTPELDEGPILAQEAFDISKCRSAKQVEAKGLKIENKLYPATLKWVLANRFRLVKTPQGRHRVHPS